MKKEEEENKKNGISRRDFMRTVGIGGAAIGLEAALSQGCSDAAVYEKHTINFTVNGKPYELEIGDRPDEVAPSHTLAHTLRETLGLIGTKVGCDHGACGLCMVLMDGKPVSSCMMLTLDCSGKNITTIEGLEDPKTGKLDPLQQSFIDNTAFQCGFCTPGIIISAKGLLEENPSPTETEVKDALSGNYCRCGSHYLAVKSVMDTAKKRG